MNKNKLIESVFSLGLLQLVTLAINFSTLIYFSRIFEKELLGKIIFLTSAGQLVSIITDYGFNLSATREVSVRKGDKKYIYDLWVNVSLVKIILAFFIFLFFLCYFFLWKSYHLRDCIISYLQVIGSILLSQWLLQGLGDLKFLSGVSILIRILFFGCTFFIVKQNNDIGWAIFIISAPSFFCGIAVFPKILQKFSDVKSSQIRLKNLLSIVKNGWNAFLSVLAINAYTTSNTVFLGLLTNPIVVANYSLSEKIIRSMQAIYIPVSNAIYPYINYSISRDREVAIKFGQRFAQYSSAVALVFGLLVCYFSIEIVDIIFGSGYADTALYLKIISFVPFFSILANSYGVLLMIPMGMDRQFARILVLAAVTNIFIFVPLVNFYGGVGAAFSNLLIECMIFFLTYYFVKREGRKT